MQKRTFLQTIGAGALSLALPCAFAKARAARASKVARPAAPATPFSLDGIDSSGRKLNLSAFAGKTILVSFFTFECDPCHEDLRLMREFYESNKAKNFTMLGVNMDKHQETYLEYIHLIEQTISPGRRFPMVWRNAPGHQDSFGKIVTLPTHILLDREQKQVLRRDGRFQSTDWDDLWTSLS